MLNWLQPILSIFSSVMSYLRDKQMLDAGESVANNKNKEAMLDAIEIATKVDNNGDNTDAVRDRLRKRLPKKPKK